MAHWYPSSFEAKLSDSKIPSGSENSDTIRQKASSPISLGIPWASSEPLKISKPKPSWNNTFIESSEVSTGTFQRRRSQRAARPHLFGPKCAYRIDPRGAPRWNQHRTAADHGQRDH